MTPASCRRTSVHITHLFNNCQNPAKTQNFLQIYARGAFNTTWHSGLLHQLPELEFSTSLVELISFSFLSFFFLANRKLIVIEGEFSVPRKIAGVPQGSILAAVLYNGSIVG
jgi:hypothetical protein